MTYEIIKKLFILISMLLELHNLRPILRYLRVLGKICTRLIYVTKSISILRP